MQQSWILHRTFLKNMTDKIFNKDSFLAQAIEVSLADLYHVRSCVVLAPHPDDESLGCGGLIAMLRNKGVDVTVIVTTDGSQSHPNSKMFPPDKVALIRREEVLAACTILDVERDKIVFLDGIDASLPSKGMYGFDPLVKQLSAILEKQEPQLILVPYELDPHCDHRATWQILNGALKNFRSTKVWEYPIWLYELAEQEDIPNLNSGELKKLNIENFLDAKIEAIASHVSQTTKMIDDDPTGFILSDDVIAHFTTNYEYFIER